MVNSLWYGSGQGAGQFRFAQNFDPATTYYWRALLECGEGIQGPYSEVWAFTTGSGGIVLPAPNLITPANGTTIPATSATLQWSSVSGAVEYRVHWRKTGTGGGTHQKTPYTQTTITGLSPNTTYEWWSAARSDYAWSNESAHWTFTTGASGPSASLDLSSFSVLDNLTYVVAEDNGVMVIIKEGKVGDVEK